MNIIEITKQLSLSEISQKKNGECDMPLVSLGNWSDDIQHVNTEQELHALYNSFSEDIVSFLGRSDYSGLGPLADSKAPSPQYYFFEYQSASKCTWWKYKNQEVMLLITGHDASSLQFIRLAVSSCRLRV